MFSCKTLKKQIERAIFFAVVFLSCFLWWYFVHFHLHNSHALLSLSLSLSLSRCVHVSHNSASYRREKKQTTPSTCPFANEWTTIEQKAQISRTVLPLLFPFLPFHLLPLFFFHFGKINSLFLFSHTVNSSHEQLMTTCGEIISMLRVRNGIDPPWKLPRFI